METVLTLFDVGKSPDDVSIHHVGNSVVIYVKTEDKVYRHVATITGVDKHIKEEKNYHGKYTDIVVDHFDDIEDKEKREVIATILHKRGLSTIEEIEATRPIHIDCGTRMELVGGSVFSYIYRCPKCGHEESR